MEPAHVDANVRTVAAGAAARLYTFSHRDDVPHHDPVEEVAARPTVVFTTGGSWTFRSGDGSVDVHPGVVLLIDAGDTYSCAHAEAYPTDSNVALELERSGPLGFRRRWVPFSAAMGAAVRQIVREERAGGPGRHLAVDGLAATFVAGLLRTDPDDGETPAHVAAARAYLETNFRADVRLSDVAAAASMSVFHLAREFKRHVGETPHQYLIRTRLEEAGALLRDTRLPVTAVAEASGFGSLSHFITTFRARTGTTPTTFRAMRGRPEEKRPLDPGPFSDGT